MKKVVKTILNGVLQELEYSEMVEVEIIDELEDEGLDCDERQEAIKYITDKLEGQGFKVLTLGDFYRVDSGDYKEVFNQMLIIK